MLIKVLAAETNLGAATNVGSATVVKILNNQGSADQVIRKDSDGNVIGSFTLAGNESVFAEKNPTDTLEGGASILAAKVAYAN